MVSAILAYFHQGDDAKMEPALGPEMARRTTRMYSIKRLTRNIGFIFPGLLDAGIVRLMKERLIPKVDKSDSEELPLLKSEWVEIKILDTLLDSPPTQSEHVCWPTAL